MARSLVGVVSFFALVAPARAADPCAGPPAPRVVMVAPAPIERDVPTNAVVIVHYQGAAVSSPDFARMHLRGAGGEQVDASAEALPWPNDKMTTIRLTPRRSLEPDSWYTITGAFTLGEAVQLGSFQTGGGE